MARNPYVVLGVAPSASDSDIRAAFRKLAKKYHPDRNPGDVKAEERFKEVAAAFDIIGDSDRRKRYDRGEIDEDGRDKGPQYRQWSPGAGGAGGGAYGGYKPTGAGASGAPFDDLGDIFADLFGARRGPSGYAQTGAQGNARARGRDLRYRLEIEFLEAALGAKKRVTMPDNRSLDLAIPAGVEDGQTLRLRGQGEAAPKTGGGAGTPGDVYVEIKVAPHSIFERDGADIHIEAPITLREAVLGGKITVPTIAGDVSVSVPKGANSGAVLRLKGRGVPGVKKAPAGDQYVKLKIVLPEGGDKELEEFVKRWKTGAKQKPRKHFADV